MSQRFSRVGHPVEDQKLHSYRSNFQNSFPATTFDQYVNSLEQWEAKLLSHMALSTDAFTVSHTLSHGIREVSDGSLWLKQMGAYGWIVSTEDLVKLAVTGMGPAPGANPPNSYRFEAYSDLLNSHTNTHRAGKELSQRIA